MSLSAWSQLIKALSNSPDKNPVFISILRGAVPSKEDESKIVLMCHSKGQKDYLNTRRVELEGMFLTYLNRTLNLEFVFEPESAPSTYGPLLNFQPTVNDVLKRSGILTHFSFDNFAVSTTNHVAFAAAQSVSQTPGSSYNPLFLYGGVGVGKTHLAQAVAQSLLHHKPDTSVYCCSGERFMNDLIESIREKNTIKFRKKYRNLHLIIVDDIQFIAGKQTVQEEFFHTFNSVVSAGGQVILTSDRPPHEIRNLEDRLRSRFSGGLIVDIQQPDFELRTAILMIKAKEKKIHIDIDVAKAIAEMITDTRSLEGTLISLYAKSLTSDSSIDLELVDSFFRQNTHKKKERLSPQDLIKAVSVYFNIKVSHIKGGSRKSDIVYARQIAMYLLRKELGIHLNEVAYLVKRKDHTTVIHAVNKIQKVVIKDPAFKEELDTIVRSIAIST